jgi:hypothetical protein
MSSEAWDELRPRIEASFGGSRCEAAYREPVGSTNDPLPGAIGDYARTNGPTDDLLVQLAPAAQGDLILVLTVAGQLPVPAKVTVHDAPRRPAGKGRSASDADPNMLQLSASLFSVARGHSVAMVDMKYTGSSARDAVEQFAARLSQSFPATVCRGWNWNVNIDPEPIRKLME